MSVVDLSDLSREGLKRIQDEVIGPLGFAPQAAAEETPCKYKGCGKSRHVYTDGRINKQFCTDHVARRKEQAAKCRGKS